MHQSRAVVKSKKTKFTKRVEEDENINDIPCDDLDEDIDIKAIRTSKDVLDREEDIYEQ